MIIIISGFACAGVLDQGLISAVKGFLFLQSHPARLLNDYTLAGGTGAALLNSAAVGAIGLFLVSFNKVRLSGPTIAAVFTIMGFGLFGKTPVNILPIIAGVYISAKIVSKSFKEYIIIALFGTALGPVVTLVIYEIGLTGMPAVVSGVAAGIAAGIILPSIAIRMLQLHQGYNLYNIGLTSGFIALFAASFFAASGFALEPGRVWNSEPSMVLTLLVPLLSLFLIIWGLAAGGKKALSVFIKLQSFSGRLPSDYMVMGSQSGALLNMGFLGAAGCLYVFLTGADFNGPVIGGLMTLIGFGAFGKHLKNSIPVIAGVFIACLVFGKNPSAPGPVLAALFCTTLAPIAGEFGWAAGITAGFLHLIMVERTGAWHSGMDLYNNGFAGGLTATLIISVIEWYKSNIEKIRR
ncbi:MAG: DUF1576 domain-containing protein [Spirochaetales bacterium]|nr:DUF1576 domain-containing protein [Spirochaetales bacterium]